MRVIAAFFSLALAAALALAFRNASAADIMTIGLKGGLSLSTLHGRLPTDAFIQNGTRRGATGGVFLTIDLGRTISLQPEALFVAKGTSLGNEGVTDASGKLVGTAEDIEAIDYLEIPILLRASLLPGGLASPYLLVGPAVGVRLSQKLMLTGDVSGARPIEIAKPTDLGLALGVGLEVGRGRIRGSVETRYTLGLTTATENTYSDSARNGNLLVTAGLAIRR